MSWVNSKEDLTVFARQYNKYVILMPKSHWFWRFISYFFIVVPLMSQERFLYDFATTLGPLVGLPDKWEDTEILRAVIVHEVDGHVNQFFGFGLWIPYIGCWLGVLGMVVFYGLLFPVLFNWFRYRLELGAEKKKFYYMKASGWSDTQILTRAERFAKTVSSWQYGKPVPESWAVRGFQKAAKAVIS